MDVLSRCRHDRVVNRDAFDRAIGHWNAGDLDSYLELYDEGIQLHGYSDAPMSKAEVRGFYQGIWGSLSGLQLTIHRIVESDDELAAHFTMTGSHTGELAGVPGTGRQVTQTA